MLKHLLRSGVTGLVRDDVDSDEGKHYAILLADTVVAKAGGPPEVATAMATKDWKEVAYYLKVGRAEECIRLSLPSFLITSVLCRTTKRPTKPKRKTPQLLLRISASASQPEPSRSTLRLGKMRGMIASCTGIMIMLYSAPFCLANPSITCIPCCLAFRRRQKENQDELLQRVNQNTLQMLSKSGAAGGSGTGPGKKITDLTAYKSINDIQHNNVLAVQVTFCPPLLFSAAPSFINRKL